MKKFYSRRFPVRHIQYVGPPYSKDCREWSSNFSFYSGNILNKELNNIVRCKNCGALTINILCEFCRVK